MTSTGVTTRHMFNFSFSYKTLKVLNYNVHDQILREKKISIVNYAINTNILYNTIIS